MLTWCLEYTTWELKINKKVKKIDTYLWCSLFYTVYFIEITLYIFIVTIFFIINTCNNNKFLLLIVHDI